MYLFPETIKRQIEDFTLWNVGRKNIQQDKKTMIRQELKNFFGILAIVSDWFDNTKINQVGDERGKKNSLKKSLKHTQRKKLHGFKL